MALVLPRDGHGRPARVPRGIGDAVLTALLGEIARRAPAGAYISLLADESGRRLYRRHGFVETGPRSVGMALPIPTVGADSS